MLENNMVDYDSIEFLRKQFLCCTPLNKFKWPDLINNINEDMQREIINATINSELVLKYPIKDSYKKAFLKLFIDKLEESKVDIGDDIYNTYCDIIASPENKSSMYYRHFVLDNGCMDDVLSIKESTNIISEGTTGLCSWKAAFYLAEWCIAHKQEIQGKNILELGSGVGLTGLTVVKCCAPKVYYFSDCHPIVLKTLEENINLNLLDKGKTVWEKAWSNNRLQLEKTERNMKVNVMNLNWEDIEKLRARQMEIDLIIAADVLYDNSTFEALAKCLRELISMSVNNYAIIVATIRNESTIAEFLNVLGKYDLSYEEETTSMPQIFIQSEETPIRSLKILRHNK